MGWKLYQMDAKTTFLNGIVDTLLLRIISMIKEEEDFPRSRKIHHRYTEEIWNVGMQVHSYSNGCKFEEAEGFYFRFKFDLSHHVLPIDWVLDVSDEHQTRHLFVVNALSQFMCELRQIHWIVAKHVLIHLRGTVGYGL